MAVSTTYYVIPDHYSSRHFADNNTFTLRYYLNNTSKYFTSHNQLHFLPGQYYINSDLIFKEINNFTITGHGINQSVIICSSPAGIIVVFASSFTIQNIALIDCLSTSEYQTLYFSYASVHFRYCSQIIINQLYVNITSRVPAGITGIYLMNVFSSTIMNVKVHVNISMCHNFRYVINGFVAFYYSDENQIYAWSPDVMINTFHYHVQKSCWHYSKCAVTVTSKNTPLIRLSIVNMVFADLSDCSLLHYHGSISREYGNATTVHILIKNVTVMRNTAAVNEFKYFEMFSIELYRFELLSNTSDAIYLESGKFRNVLTIKFYNCSFMKNSNIHPMIYVSPSIFSEIKSYIVISNSTFHNNKDVHFLRVERNNGALPNMITNVFLTNLIVSNNDHQRFGDDLIFITNGDVRMANNVFVGNYYKYKSLIALHSSILYFQLSNSFIKNKARYIINAQRESIFFIFIFAAVSIVDNIAYKVVLQVNTPGVSKCPLQVYDIYEQRIYYGILNKINCTFSLLNNTEMISKSLPGQFPPFNNIDCEWLGDTFYPWRDPKPVYHKIIKLSNTVINKTSERFIPLSVCPCSHNDRYNCNDVSLGSVFPGQTLHIKLTVPRQWSSKYSSAIIVANTKDDDCSIVDSYQLSQSHPISHDCNNYSYTIRSNSRHTTECKLFIGLSEMPEMFYVQIKPCPVGFTLQSNKKSCDCDPLLLNNNILSITSCNLDDETILRPANS